MSNSHASLGCVRENVLKNICINHYCCMSGVSLSGSGGPPVIGSTNPGAVELSDTGGRALKLQTDTPHLVSMGGDRLSTSVTLHPIPQGRVTLGSGPRADIHVQGTGVLPLHCHIENSEGIVTIYPLSENLSIDGVKVTSPTRLSQGVMLTIGRSNYLRFNHPAEAKLIKSVLPNPRISMAPINFEPDNSYQTKFNKKPPVAPRKSPRESFSDSSSDEPPSSIMTKVSKFEYLAAQNYKKSISPKVFPSNVVTVNTPIKDVLGKAPPDLNSFTKNLPQSALNYAELNSNEKHQVKIPGQQLLSKKTHHQSQYVNVTVNETKNINNRVIIFENGCIPKSQNVNFDHNELNNKSSNANKNININRGNTPSPSFNRNPGGFLRSITPSPISNIQKIDHRRSGSLGELTNYMDGYEDLAHRKYEAELKRNQAQQDRIKEQEIEKAEQQRLEEILNMCAEYEKQQCEKNKPITPNRIITNGSLPRDKRGQFGPPSPSYSSTPPPSPLDILHNELLKQNNHHNYENVSINYGHPTTNTQYDSFEIKSSDNLNGEHRSLERSSPYENVYIQHNPPGPYPSSPRTRIKTFITSNKDNSSKEHLDPIENKFALLEAEQILLREAELVLRQNLHNSKEFPPDHDIFETPPKSNPPNQFIFPFENSTDVSKSSPSSIENNQVNNDHSPNTSSNYSSTKEFNKKYKEQNEEERKKLEHLRKEKKDILAVMSRIKRQMADIETQEEELHGEIELERALISGEHKSKLLDLEKIEAKKQKLQKRSQRIEESMRDCQMKQDEDQQECKKKLQLAQENMAKVDEKLSSTPKSSPEYEQVFEEYLHAQEQLDNERKAFEDLEFHHLEEEADWLASREELQREILDFTKRIDTLKSQIFDLEQQKMNTSKTNTNEFKTIEKQKMECMMRLEEIQNRLRSIENELLMHSNEESEQEISSDTDSDKSKDIDKQLSNNSLDKMTDLSCSIIVSTSKIPNDDMYNMSQSFNEKMFYEKSILEVGIDKKFPSQDDIDRISRVTSDAPINITDGQGSLGRKTIESLREIERNRHLHLCQQGSQVIEQERQRVNALKQRVQEEVKSKWAQRVKDCNSFNSSSSELSGNSFIEEDNKNEERLIVDHQNSKESVRNEAENAESPRPLSDTSEMSLEVGTLNRKRKPVSDKQRPLTRYLPIRGSDLDLRQHIESAGHQVVLCPHVIINSSTCRGFLHKKGSKLNGWSRRWFVFDRNKHTFSYYSDKSEKKPRGGAYFQAIEEVYLDHLNSMKSPNPQLSFIVKTHERFYYLMAPSPEAMRIWVDVIFTGAEGYREFEHGT
ncbi:uncharacterized protein isoform X2 [Leptinotarsa decemlineata]|uniref:uncharacterized protein isoform X2 n=1 Tax=Leptinotarsa decemlineata TaxID=7539 RepID=UPI003D30910D